MLHVKQTNSVVADTFQMEPEKNLAINFYCKLDLACRSGMVIDPE